MYRLLIAFLYLKSRLIFWISLVGVTIGTCSLVVVDSIWNGFIREQQKLIRGSQADVLVSTPFSNIPTRFLVDVIAGVEGVAGVAPRLIAYGLIPTDVEVPSLYGLGQLSRGPVLELAGIELEDELQVSELRRYLEDARADLRVEDLDRPFEVDGTRDVPGGPFAVILGEKMALALSIERGGSFQVLTASEVNEDGTVTPLQGEFVLSGTFRTGKFDVDLSTAYMKIEDLRRFAQLPDHANELAVRKQPEVTESDLKSRLCTRLATFGIAPEFVKTWSEPRRILIGAVENQRNILNVILFFVIVVAGFNLLVTLNMMIAEKLHDIGALASMGASSLSIGSIFIACGLLVSLFGSGLGLLLGCSICWRINEIHDVLSLWIGRPLFREDVYGIARIPIEIDPLRVGVYVLATVVTTLLFSAFASFRAARQRPVEALRRE